MELTLKPNPKNTYPLGAVWIRNGSVHVWVAEIGRMGFALETVAVYPIPGNEPLSLWGCLVVPAALRTTVDLGKNTYAQCVNGKVYLPENASLFPAVSLEELNKLFPGQAYAIHPEVGWVELSEPLDWQTVLAAPTEKKALVHTPSKPVFMPSEIKSFQIKPVPVEEVLKQLEGKEAFSGIKKLEDEALTPAEKVKLESLRSLFKRKENADGTFITEKKGLLSAWEKLRGLFTGKESKATQRLREQFEDLEERNREAIERLLELFRKNPEEALKYAIPLNGDGTTRGGEVGSFSLSKRWMDFSLFGAGGGGRSSSGSITLPDDHVLKLNQQYRQTAQELIQRKEYQKAAFIYIKLLKEHDTAAQVMEDGRLYQEAAAIHLKYTQNKNRAAGCYEKGRMYGEAIDLYKELKQNEKAGDLYVEIGHKKEAREQYTIVTDDYKNSHQYVKASLIYRNKMNEPELGQESLMEGWRTNRDAYNCLNNYFQNVDDVKQLGLEIDRVYHHETDKEKQGAFLNVIKVEYEKKNGLEEPIRDIAYEIIAEELKKNPEYVSELRNFNEPDKELTKDTLRYILNRKKK